MPATHRVFMQPAVPDSLDLMPAVGDLRTLTQRQAVAGLQPYSELLWDIVEIMKAELARLARDGVKYIQIDAPRYSYFIDPKWRQYLHDEMGVNPDEALSEAIRADNACLEGARRDKGTAVVVTFDPHPVRVLRPGQAPRLLRQVQARG